MRCNSAILLPALAAVSFASPTNNGYTLTNARGLEGRAVSPVDMTFVGQAFVDGPNVTLSGTAESVYSQLLAINPEYNAWDFPDYVQLMKSLGISQVDAEAGTTAAAKSSLSKRDYTNCDFPRDPVGDFYGQCGEGLRYLRRLNGNCGAPPGRGGCSRVSCSNKCGIWLCNDNPNAIGVPCGWLASDAEGINSQCPRPKGQVFRDPSPRWNTILQRDNC